MRRLLILLAISAAWLACRQPPQPVAVPTEVELDWPDAGLPADPVIEPPADPVMDPPVDPDATID